MECYWHVIDHMEIWSIRYNKTGFFPGFTNVNTQIWMHCMDSYEMQREKTDGNKTRMLHAVPNKSWK